MSHICTLSTVLFRRAKVNIYFLARRMRGGGNMFYRKYGNLLFLLNSREKIKESVLNAVALFSREELALKIDRVAIF